jgi:hypothetical protein
MDHEYHLREENLTINTKYEMAETVQENAANPGVFWLG